LSQHLYQHRINIDEARCAVRGVPGAASMVFYYEAIATMSLSDAVRVEATAPGKGACLHTVAPVLGALSPL